MQCAYKNLKSSNKVAHHWYRELTGPFTYFMLSLHHTHMLQLQSCFKDLTFPLLDRFLMWIFFFWLRRIWKDCNLDFTHTICKVFPSLNDNHIYRFNTICYCIGPLLTWYKRLLGPINSLQINNTSTVVHTPPAIELSLIDLLSGYTTVMCPG